MNYPNNSGYNDYYYPPPKQPQGLATASMVLGIIALACCGATATIGLILGIISLAKKEGGRGMAIAGVVMCGISLLSYVAVIIIYVIYGAAMFAYLGYVGY